MPGSRKEGKLFKGAWLEPSRIDELKRICTSLGLDFTDFLRKIADGSIVVSEKKEGRK